MKTPESHTLPTCIGFIMDGNRRWAKAQGHSLLEGHSEGYRVFSEVVRWLTEKQIAHAVFYAFSTENWKRNQDEVQYLMDLFRYVFATLEESIEAEGTKVRVRFIGERTDLPVDMQEKIRELETKSAKYTNATTVWVALSYGGRAELVSAIKALVQSGDEVSEASIRAHLWSADMPDPDLIIRTSGEQRLSNFLPWQSVYSELYFTPTYWPAFTKAEFERILSEYVTRERRLGA